MSWLKRIQPITLSQSSDVPYVITEDGVKLCFTNMYTESEERDDHFIRFNVNRHDLRRQSATFYKFLEFPVTIPFEAIIACDETIIEGKVIKHASKSSSDSSDIVIVKSDCVDDMDDDRFQDLVDVIDSLDHAFLLVGEEISPQSRLLDDLVTTVYHEGDWGRTCVAIVDHVTPGKQRKYCWTQRTPALNVQCYGLDDSDEMAEIHDILSFIGVTSSVAWED